MPKRRISPVTLQAWGGFALVVLLVLAAAYAVGSRLEGAAAARQAVEETGNRIDRLNLLLRELLDAEVGQRGYVIAGNPQFLEPFRASSAEVDDTLRAITADARPSAVEQQRCVRLLRLVRAKFRFMNRTIEVRRTQGLDSAAALVANLEGKRIMDAIRAEIADMIAYERSQLAARTQALQAQERRTQQVIYAALVGALLLVLAIGLMLLRELRGRIRAQRVARQSATLMRVTLDNIGAAVVVADEDGAIVSRNAELLHLVPEAEHEPAPEAIAAELAMAREGRPFLFERPIAGYEVAVVRGVPLPGGRFLVSYLDISAARRAERVKSEFVSTVSHELRTPVTSIRGALGMLAGPLAAGLSDKQKSLADMALRNADRLTLLVNDILDIEKIESGRMEFDIGACDVNQLLADAAETNRAYAEARGVVLTIGTLRRPLRVEVDAHRIQQVMANLISNAVKFSDEGGIVTLTAEEEDGRARVSVQDRGPGIPDAFKSRIFERFAQADASDTRAKAGTGLGLSIARAIVERHGGTLSFESEPGDTVFSFTVPLCGADAGAPRQEST
jgi:signal transduction histidine kinase